MSHYRKIDVRLHSDAKFLSLSTLLSRQLFLTILSHPDILGMGAMRFSVEGLRAFMNTSLPEDQKAFPKAFREAFEEVLGKGLAKASEKDSFLYLPNFLKYNRPENANVMKGWLKVWDYLPECELKIEVYDIVKAFVEGSSKAFQKDLGEGFLKALAKGLPKAESSKQRAVSFKNPPLEENIPPKKNSAKESPPIPDWLDPLVWKEFQEHRKKIRKPMTSLAERKILSELEKFRALGQNPVEILNRSIMNGWTGVFELKNDSRTPDSLTDHNQRLGERWLSKEA